MSPTSATTLSAEGTAQIQVFKSEDAEVISAFGQTARILLSAKVTDKTISIAEITVPPLEGPPPHVHHAEDEAFIVKEGHFEFWINGDRVQAETGDVVYGPRDVPHTFTNLEEEPGTLQVISVSAGFESFFRQCSEVWQSEDGFARVAEIAQAHDLEFVDPAAPTQTGSFQTGKIPTVIRPGQGEFLVTPEGQGSILISDKDTAGDFAMGNMIFPQYGGPLPHIHALEDEIFIVQRGTFEFFSGDHQLQAQPGDVVWLPKQIPHNFRCLTHSGGELMGIFVPGNFVNYFREGAALFSAGQPQLSQIQNLISKYELTFLTPTP